MGICLKLNLNTQTRITSKGSLSVSFSLNESDATTGWNGLKKDKAQNYIYPQAPVTQKIQLLKFIYIIYKQNWKIWFDYLKKNCLTLRQVWLLHIFKPSETNDSLPCPWERTGYHKGAFIFSEKQLNYSRFIWKVGHKSTFLIISIFRTAKVLCLNPLSSQL